MEPFAFVLLIWRRRGTTVVRVGKSPLHADVDGNAHWSVFERQRRDHSMDWNTKEIYDYYIYENAPKYM